MRKIVILLLIVVVCLSLSSCHYAQMAFDSPIVKNSIINKLILASWYFCSFLVFIPLLMSLSEGKRCVSDMKDSLCDVGATIFGFWGGTVLLLLLMSRFWYPFLWLGDNNMLIKLATLILIPIVFIWLYINILFTDLSMRLWSVFAFLSEVICIVDCIVTLWNMKD